MGLIKYNSYSMSHIALTGPKVWVFSPKVYVNQISEVVFNRSLISNSILY